MFRLAHCCSDLDCFLFILYCVIPLFKVTCNAGRLNRHSRSSIETAVFFFFLKINSSSYMKFN